MLQAALEREAAQFCRLDRAKAEAELADPEKAKDVDELTSTEAYYLDAEQWIRDWGECRSPTGRMLHESCWLIATDRA